MIRTSVQLKAKIRNLASGDSTKSQTLLRTFIMERFLERISLSAYRDNFILKGGMLVASLVGLHTRATMDIDTTLRSATLSQEEAVKIVQDVIGVEVDDGVTFAITKVEDVMEGHDYPGIRFVLQATLDRLRQKIKIDISTGDAITPQAVEYAYKLMFEDRHIKLWTYSVETLLAEKLETIMARGALNTRMRDFYDVHVIATQEKYRLDLLREAFLVTSHRRHTSQMIDEMKSILNTVAQDETMRKLWDNYVRDSFFVENLTWDEVMQSVQNLAQKSQITKG